MQEKQLIVSFLYAHCSKDSTSIYPVFENDNIKHKNSSYQAELYLYNISYKSVVVHYKEIFKIIAC